MIKKMSKSAQIRKYVAAHPTAKSREVADALGVKRAYVYSVIWAAKQKAKPEKITLNPTPNKWKTLHISSSDNSVEKEMELAYMAGMGRIRNPQIEMFEPKPDAVNHPPHYKVGGIETIDFIEAKKLGYNLGNVVKYLTRADHKGNRKQDLEKAKWYLERELSATT